MKGSTQKSKSDLANKCIAATRQCGLSRFLARAASSSSRLVLMFFAVIHLVASSTLADQIFGYDVSRLGINVGEGLISFETLGKGTKVTYRMNISVSLLGVTFYYLDSHQIAFFDNKGNLRFARASADIDGEKHEVSVERKGSSFEIVHNGEKRILASTEFISTTLNPLFQPPVSGVWLDLTYGSLVPYGVTTKGKKFHLTRPDGDDVLQLDSSQFLQKIESSTAAGTLLLERTLSGKHAAAKFKHPSRVFLSPEELERFSSSMQKSDRRESENDTLVENAKYA